MLKNLKNKMNNKGFSLVELIVVIAIMVILMAMLIPNVVGYINKATHTTEMNGASTVFSAAQTYATDLYAQGSYDEGAITVENLLSAQLLTKEPTITYSISCNATSPVVEMVSFTGSDGSLYSYPEG